MGYWWSCEEGVPTIVKYESTAQFGGSGLAHDVNGFQGLSLPVMTDLFHFGTLPVDLMLGVPGMQSDAVVLIPSFHCCPVL